MTLHFTAVAAKDGGGTSIPGGIDQHDTSGTGAGPNIPAIVNVDSTGAEPLGTTADVAYAGSGNAGLVAIFKGMYAAIINPPTLGSTSGGLSTNYQDALTATVVAVNAAACQLYELYAYNPNASVVFVQIFDAATVGAVTLGTTVPKLSFGIPANAASGEAMSLGGIQFTSGIMVACTTTSKGLTAPGTAVPTNFMFK